MTRLLLFLLLALVAVAGLWYIFTTSSQVPDLEEVAVVEDTDERPVDLSADGVELMHGDAGHLKWRLTADSASFLQEDGLVELNGPMITYLMDGVEGEVRVTAAHGVIEQDMERARLWPDVTASWQDNVIQAQELVYEGSENTLRLTGGVSLAGPTITCEAEEMRFDLTSNVLSMGPGVRTTFMVTMPGDEISGVEAPGVDGPGAEVPGVDVPGAEEQGATEQ